MTLKSIVYKKQLVVKVLKKKKRWLHSVPSYKERSYKERLVEMLQSKEQRLVEI